MNKKEVTENLCYYDLRNPDGIVDTVPHINTVEEVEEMVEEKKVNGCDCENCFYGRTELAENLLKYMDKDLEKSK